MLKNYLNFFLFLLILFFFFFVFKYYFSNQNIKDISINRNNSENVLKDKMSNIPVLSNDTDQVIEFNTGFNQEIENKKSRNFWKLLKFE